MEHLKKLSRLLSLLFVASSVTAQVPLESKVSFGISNYYTNYQPEKVYVQTDKENYLTGEDIWLNVIVTINDAPTDLSKIVYAELCTASGFVLQRLMLPIENGKAAGNFYLKDQRMYGFYYIKAYTAWLRNFDASFYFEKKIFIRNPAASVLPQSEEDDFTVDFFPEGGNLVKGLISEVAFKSQTGSGMPVPVTGRVINKAGNTVALINTLHNGIGRFLLRPSEQDDAYTAEVESDKGIKKIFPLPKVLSSGIVLHLHNNKLDSASGELCFKITRSVSDKRDYQSLLLCTQQNKTVNLTAIDFDATTAGDPFDTTLYTPSPLPIEGFTNGLVHVTVLNKKDGSIAAERLVYLDSGKIIQPNITVAAKSFTPEALNNISLQIPSAFAGDVAVNITDADSAQNNENNIVAYLQLVSNIKEYIHDAGWYISNNSIETQRALDALLITSHWAFFDWAKILNNNLPDLLYMPEESLSISGRAFTVSDKADTSVMRDGNFNLMLKDDRDSSLEMFTVPVDSSGYFTLTGFHFHDTALLYTQNSGKKNKISVKFDANSLDTVRITAIQHPATVYDLVKADEQAAKDSDAVNAFVNSTSATPGIADTTGLTLASVTVTAKAKTHTDSTLEKYTTALFNGKQARTYDLTDDEEAKNSSMNVIQYIQTHIPGPTITGNTTSVGVPIVYWRLNYGLFIPGLSLAERQILNAPSFYLDEAILNEGSNNYEYAMYTLTSIQMRDVALIRVFQPGSFPLISGNAPNGVITVYLRYGVDAPNKKKYFDKYNMMGFSVADTFANVNRSKEFVKNINLSNTLYWNTSLQPDAQHNININFYNNRTAKRFRIIAEGIDTKGNLLRLEKIIE